MGENAPHYIDGRWIKKHYCVDCGKEISNQSSKRCLSCATSIEMKKRWQNPKFKKNKSGKNSNLYKDGKCLKKYYCIYCGKEVSILNLVC